MIISCNNCNKKFNLDSNLIPENGRLLQCASCDHKWFFKKEVPEDTISPIVIDIKNDNINTINTNIFINWAYSIFKNFFFKKPFIITASTLQQTTFVWN